MLVLEFLWKFVLFIEDTLKKQRNSGPLLLRESGGIKGQTVGGLAAAQHSNWKQIFVSDVS